MNVFFIHIPKNAGSSIRRAGAEGTRPHTLKPDYLTALNKAMLAEGLTHHAGHGRWRDLKEEYQNRECFSVVRNPYSRVVSRYTFLVKINDEAGKPSPSFREWLETRHAYKDKPFWWHRTTMNWYPQREHVIDDKGIVRCRIFRHENLEEAEEFLGKKLARKNESNCGAAWMDFYDDDSRKVIEDWYKEDFELFGYET